jgi:hypothetical protein
MSTFESAPVDGATTVPHSSTVAVSCFISSISVFSSSRAQRMNLNLLFDSLVTVQIKLRVVVVVVETLAWFLSPTSSKRRYREEENGTGSTLAMKRLGLVRDNWGCPMLRLGAHPSVRVYPPPPHGCPAQTRNHAGGGVPLPPLPSPSAQPRPPLLRRPTSPPS